MQPREIHFSPEEEARAAAAAFRRDKRNVTSATVLLSLALAAVFIWHILIPEYSLLAVGAAITLIGTGLFCLLDIVWRRRCSRRGHLFVRAGTFSGVEIYQCLHCREKRYSTTDGGGMPPHAAKPAIAVERHSEHQ
jgi:hypothetical protein